jgi:hypothetical protein
MVQAKADWPIDQRKAQNDFLGGLLIYAFAIK